MPPRGSGFRPTVEALAGKCSREGIGELAVLPVEGTDLASAHADIPGGNIETLSQVTVQLIHERMAEPHHFLIGLSFRVEIRAAFRAAQR